MVGDKTLTGLFYVAGGAGGCWKTLDGYASANYIQIRKPGTGTAPSDAVYTQIGADGRLSQAPVTSVVVVSNGSNKAYDLGTFGQSGGHAEPSWPYRQLRSADYALCQRAAN